MKKEWIIIKKRKKGKTRSQGASSESLFNAWEGRWVMEGSLNWDIKENKQLQVNCSLQFSHKSCIKTCSSVHLLHPGQFHSSIYCSLTMLSSWFSSRKSTLCCFTIFQRREVGGGSRMEPGAIKRDLMAE